MCKKTLTWQNKTGDEIWFFLLINIDDESSYIFFCKEKYAFIFIASYFSFQLLPPKHCTTKKLFARRMRFRGSCLPLLSKSQRLVISLIVFTWLSPQTLPPTLKDVLLNQFKLMVPKLVTNRRRLLRLVRSITLDTRIGATSQIPDSLIHQNNIQLLKLKLH